MGKDLLDVGFNPQSPKRPIDFSVSVAEFVEHSKYYNNPLAIQYGYRNLQTHVLNYGVFFRAAQNRRQNNYWYEQGRKEEEEAAGEEARRTKKNKEHIEQEPRRSKNNLKKKEARSRKRGRGRGRRRRSKKQENPSSPPSQNNFLRRADAI